MGEILEWSGRPGMWSGPDSVPVRLVEHIWYSALAVLIATVIALPLGLLIGHTGRGSLLAASLSNFWRALPTLGVVILIFRLEPLSLWPVLVALVIIAIPPILLNTDVGIRSIDPRVRDAARGMGMTGPQALWEVEIPLALPLILTGLRSATGQVVAAASIAAFVGLGGLGRYIIDGYATRDIGQITGGAVLVALLALAVEGGFALLQRALGHRQAPRPPVTGPAAQPREVRA
jgi:osmoprotectant transport system permease protein